MDERNQEYKNRIKDIKKIDPNRMGFLLQISQFNPFEFDVFKCLIKGLGVNDIAKQLSISNKTVFLNESATLSLTIKGRLIIHQAIHFEI